MKYTFASLGKMESIGVRLGGAGLGNILFPNFPKKKIGKSINVTIKKIESRRIAKPIILN